VLTADDVSLKRPLINLLPSGVQVWKNLELAPSHERNNLLQPKFIDPHAISHEIPHLVIEHG
jgi:hypothetical protein